MGLREVPIFFFAVGVVHYLVLFVTLYQRLPTNAQLPKELHPPQSRAVGHRRSPNSSYSSIVCTGFR
jgi:hypothetical protein